MTDKAISSLRQRLIDDMAIRRLGPKTQYQYIRHVKRFADFVGRSVDKATTEDVHRYQLWLASIGTTVPTVNVSATALRFFFIFRHRGPAWRASHAGHVSLGQLKVMSAIERCQTAALGGHVERCEACAQRRRL